MVPEYGEKEAAAVASALEVEALVGDAATAETVAERLCTAGVAHLSCHGLHLEMMIEDGTNLVKPKIGWQLDRLLGLHEFSGKRLQADLVTLSACSQAKSVLTERLSPISAATR